MKRFLLHTFLFLIALLAVVVTKQSYVNYRIDHGNFFRLPKKKTVLILGNSHPECALNDTLIPTAENCAHSSEGYFYTYIKLKKLLAENPQIKTVFLEFNNGLVMKKVSNWMWGDEYINWRYCRYSPFMNWEELALVWSKNPKIVLDVQNTALKENQKFLESGATNYIKSRPIGGYLPLNYSQVDSLLKVKANIKNLKLVINEPDEKQLEYLRKIQKYCSGRSVRLFLMRCPQHKKYEGWSNEFFFQKVRQEKFSDLPFFDFGHFELPQKEYGDLEHLNYWGAKRFSKYFNQFLQEKDYSK